MSIKCNPYLPTDCETSIRPFDTDHALQRQCELRVAKNVQTNVCVLQPPFPENSSGFNSFLAHTDSHYAIGNVLYTCLYHVGLPTGIPAPRELSRESKFSKAP